MIERLSSDKLDDQRVSPIPGSLEPSDSEDLKKSSPGEMRSRSQSHGKKRSPGSGGEHHQHKPLASSRSTGSIELQREQHDQVSARNRHQRRSKDIMLRPPGHMNMHITRTHSGGAMLSGSSSAAVVAPRSLSPPANVGSGGSAQELRNRTLSPPPPTSRPPPLPSHAKRPPSSRWSGMSYKSTDSASSEDSLTTDLPPRYPRHAVTHGSAELIQGIPERPGFFVGVNPQGPSYQQDKLKSYQHGTRPMSAPRGNPGQQDPAHSVVKNAYNSSSGGGSNMPPTGTSSSAGNLAVNSTQHARKTSWQSKYANASHPLQMSVSTGRSQSIGSTLSSYPWHNAHSLPQQQHKQPKRSVCTWGGRGGERRREGACGGEGRKEIEREVERIGE